ncbi:methyltransferase-like 26 isoform X2 [Rhynchophorus ferrugineus]|uniref:methyltransferase-like 26 isoform X2 n=1 Tax=Rhynchophorus ferrugineus TaxID=354439 RepID=UPI003FCDA8DF
MTFNVIALWMILVKNFVSGGMRNKINYPSAERNKFFILEVLRKHVDGGKAAKMLEIASGTGQHAAYFGAKFPRLTVQPSEIEEGMLESIGAYASEVSTKNVKPPLKIDVNTDPSRWGTEADYDFVLNVNMFHVTPLACSVAFFKNCSKILKPGGLLFTYGPYANCGVLEPESNVDFDRRIRQRDPNCGVRDIQDLSRIAAEHGVSLKAIYDLPANNKCLVWQKA